MTTHDTHSEHSDVNETVVERQPVEMQATASTDARQEVPEAPFGDSLPSEPAPGAPQTQGAQTAFAAEKTSAASTQDGEQAALHPTAFADAAPAGTGDAATTPSQTQEAAAAAAFAGGEEVRPFTDFIEEFRQTEARFSSSLQAYQSEAPASEEAAAALPQPEETQALEPVAGQESRPQKAQTTATSTERPVSPLLRPASRLRMPRHASSRQHEETPAVEKAAQKPAEAEAKVVEPPAAEPQRPPRRYRFDRPAAAANGSAPAGAAPSRAAEGKEMGGAGARPANGPTTNGQSAAAPADKDAHSQAASKQGPGAGEVTEQIVPAETTAEGGAAQAGGAPVTPLAPENDRRKRHGQERQRGKEQTHPPTAAPVVAEAAVSTQEAALPQPAAEVKVEGEAGPEDLPPLEYAELQKANSRRRRRRHTSSPVPLAPATAAPAAEVPAAPGTSLLAGKTVTPEAPQAAAPAAPAPTTPASTPRSPAISAATPGQYAITSGFTVKQMNQGNEDASPFMGPDPSPARGSQAAQNVRSLRTDVQRAPAYPVRTTEATSASVHQLANIVSQAIQTQTDRMIAELRRANQNPTNVSVTMPPFPSTERVGVFVDVANLLYSARTLRLTVDFGKLLDFLRGNRRLVRAHAYCPTSPQPGDEQMFLQAVKGLGYRITTKNYKTFSSGAKKADLDLDLCMDVVRIVDGKAVDCVVLVSGDSDFMPMLDYCSDHGVRVEVAAFDEAMSATLRQSCDLFINLGMLEEIRV